MLFLLKSRFCEKTTKIEATKIEISIKRQKQLEDFFQILVAISEYLNFTVVLIRIAQTC